MSDSTIIGWTSVAETNAALAQLFGSELWTDSDSKEILLNSSFLQLRDHPNYTIPEFDSKEWLRLKANEQRRIIEAQQLHALDIAGGGGANNENAKLRSQGVKSFSISKFSLAFDGKRENLNKSEIYLATELSQLVKDKLFAFLKSTPIIGSFERSYP